MATEHLLAMMPNGVIELCREWFDEDCPSDLAFQVAETATATFERRSSFNCLSLNCSTIGGAIVWLKSRLRERGVLRALADAIGVHDGTPADVPPPAPMTPAEWKAFQDRIDRQCKGYVRSRISRSQLLLSPINAAAERVIHFEDSQHCPYCRRWHRNGAALRLHVIERHPQAWSATT